MFPSSRRSPLPEATKPQAAAPNFVLSLLAACSTSVPTEGKEGEATLSQQLRELLNDTAMDVNELNLMYNYRFGLSIANALKCIGFDGNFEDFAIKQKCFSICEGCISFAPADLATPKEPARNEPTKVDEPAALDELQTVDEPAAVDEPFASEEPVKDVQEEVSGSSSDVDSDVDIPGWRGVGSRLVAALQDSCETASNAPTESTDEGDAESDIDISGWHSVGSRLITAMGSPEEDEVDTGAWKSVASRVAASLHDEEDDVDAHCWRDVSCRIASACKDCSENDCLEDPHPDVSQWRSVGARVVQCFNDDIVNFSE